MNLYENKSRIKLIILIGAITIGSLSLYYTNSVVQQLSEREKKYVELYANALKYSISSELTDEIEFLNQQIISTNTSIPVILTDQHHQPLAFRNLALSTQLPDEELQNNLVAEMKIMARQHIPIEVNYGEGPVNYIYYKDSYLLSQLKYYPYVQLTVIFMFILLGYMAFNYSRSSEQNKVWIGLAKETAHQLGTPLSSLIGWIEYLRTEKGLPEDIVEELNKDVQRLEMITARFSSIGSIPVLKEENIIQVVQHIAQYLQKRISARIPLTIHSTINPSTTIAINRPLFEWVIENICKNAVDAIGEKSEGKIDITITSDPRKNISIEIADNGKGIPKKLFKKIFEPGYSSKKRGWGLGLTLAKRIIEQYHHGKISIKQSEIDQGSVFKIILYTK